MKPVIFVCGHRKGGTSMFHNLFDGHSDVSVYPVDLNVLYGYFPQYTQEKYSESVLKARLKRVIFDDLKTIPMLEDKINIDVFEKHFFDNIKPIDLSNIGKVIETLLASYADIYIDNHNFKYHLFKETSIELYAQELSGLFPNSKFLHLIRDPRDNFAAISSGLDVKYQGYGDSKNSLMFSMINRALYGFKMARINQELLGPDNYKVVRFEDLVCNTQSKMEEVCNWLELPFEECLLTPSIFGNLNTGNNFEKEKFQGVSGNNIGRWRERISQNDAALIEVMFEPEMALYGYQKEIDAKIKAEAIGDFYKWSNYKYLYHDRFSNE